MNMFNLSLKRKLAIMGAVMASLLLAALDQTIVGTALPRIVSDLNGMEHYTWVVTAYLLTSTITVPISGKLSDLFGRRPLLLAGISVFVGASMLAGLSQNMWMLIAFRALQGIGGGILMSNTIAVVGDLFVPAERAKWQGMIGGVFGLSSVIGPLLGGWLTDNASWRWTFYINVPVGIVALALILIFLPNIKHAAKQTIDYLGAVLLAGALAQLVLALTWGGSQYAWGSMQIIGLFVGSAIATVLFLLNEYYMAKDPILPLDLFLNRTFTLSSIVMFLFGLAMFGTIMYIPLFAQDVQGSSATNSGVILMPMVVGILISSIGSGQIVSRTGKYKLLALFGMLGSTLTILWMSTLNVHSTGSDLAWRMVVTGLCMGSAMPIFNLIVQNAFSHDRLGIATSSTQLFRSLGATVGVAVMGGIMNSELTKRIGDLGKDPFIQSLNKARPDMHLTSIDVNKLQQLLSPKTIATIQQQIAQQVSHLPAMMQAKVAAAANANLAHFMDTAKTAIAGSISHVFLVAAAIVSVSCVAVLLLKEIPLRRGHETAAELAGSELAVDMGDFAPEDEPEVPMRAKK
jgi:EmrB/QacA subfamily drug resistance transporter